MISTNKFNRAMLVVYRYMEVTGYEYQLIEISVIPTVSGDQIAHQVYRKPEEEKKRNKSINSTLTFTSDHITKSTQITITLLVTRLF